LNVQPPEAGYIKVNTIKAKIFPWEGVYFTEVSVILEAKPNYGFEFDSWQGISISDPLINLISLNDTNFTAVFYPITPDTNCIVITEIMYNPPESGEDSLEFIELYNNGNIIINLEDFYFSKGIEFTFPYIEFEPEDYLVIAKSSDAILNTFEIASLQWISGSLKNCGEEIEIKDIYGNVVDYVNYSDDPPWDTLADGYGPSLTLCNPNDDNSNPLNWQASDEFVTLNSNNDSIFASAGGPCGFYVWYPQFIKYKTEINIFPNPNNGKFFIKIDFVESSEFEITVYNILGKKVFEKQNIMTGTQNKNMIDTGKLPEGVYFVHLKTKFNTYSEKIIIKH
ncbi:MAG: lamin tail domain-containing protein, partial [Bacteroidales bacterium]|nr:lamin tail domain-containing protein [Bacteroidales bacterium]